jgi:hypothetical protein
MVLLVYLVVRPAPIILSGDVSANTYESGANVHGIVWNDVYSEAVIRVANESGAVYSNVDMTVKTDLTIAQIAIEYNYASCTSHPNMDGMELTLFGQTSDGKEIAIPPAAGISPYVPTYRIICENLVPNSEIRIDIAMIHMNLFIERKGPDKALPKVASISISYDAYLRSRNADRTFCFDPDRCLRK